MNYSKRFRTEPGSKVDLEGIDPAIHGPHANHHDAGAELQHNLQRITSCSAPFMPTAAIRF